MTSNNDIIQTNNKRSVEGDPGEGSSKRVRQNFNFWKKSEKPDSVDDPGFLEVKDLNIGRYVQKPIRIRVSYKGYPRETKVGTVMTFHGIDNTGEIAFINYGKECLRLNEELKVNSVYCIENFVVENEKSAYPNNLTTQFQIKLNSYTNIKITEDNDSIVAIPFNFIPLNAFGDVIDKNKIDVIGVIVKDDGVEQTDRGSYKRELVLTDESKELTTVILWSKEAQNFEAVKFSIVAIRNANLIDYDGQKKLNCLSGTLVWSNPSISKAVELSSWFQKALPESIEFGELSDIADTENV